MRYFDSIVCFVMAGIAAYGGATAKEFYPGRLGRKSTGKPLPKWLGRLWVLGVAVWMLYLGIKALP